MVGLEWSVPSETPAEMLHLLRGDLFGVDLTECIHLVVLESQLPHKIANLLFSITNQNIELTVLWGG